MDLDEAEKLAQDYIDRYLGHTWHFCWDDAPKRFGRCNHNLKLITLSRHCVRLNGLTEVLETIRHEVAHAIAGPGHGHDAHWWDISRRLGCTQGARHRAQVAPTYMRFSFGGD